MNRLKTIGILALVVLLLPLLLIYVAAYMVLLFVWGIVLRVWFWRAHAARGRPGLFVYSESPNWQAYIEENILPRIGNRAVVLNWSERQLWDTTTPWEGRFFRRFAGDREFNPVALVFSGRGHIQTIRFHQAFLDLKHGRDSALRAAEAELFSLLPPTNERPEAGSPSSGPATATES
jgi:hypothetical protein